MSWKLCAAVTFTGGTPAIGSDTLPSGVTVRRLPRRSLIRNLPSGRNAIAHGPVSLSVIVSVRYLDFCFGGGAWVWPANAGFGCGWSASVTVATVTRLELAIS